ncbi:molecular chaperone DnaJ [Rhodoblastus sp.]|uniref:molecular chaperone DnaJ n=1 Tax=Rhodoblastus sp. TaxID=1962975 RepID=UPI0035B3BF3B
MLFLVFGLLALILGVHLLRQLGRASPAKVAENLRMGGGALAAAMAILVLMRGRLPLALGFGGLSLYLFTGERLSWKIPWAKFAQQAANRRQARNRSRIRTAFLDMTLDLASGDVDGTVLAGIFEGARLSALPREALLRLRAECAARDPDSVLLLDNYLDRRFPGGGAADEGDADAGGNRAGRGRSGEMTEEEAYQALGLRAGASSEEIIRAHRRLMKERHPDHGGTTDDAARLNQAKDRLLRRQG